MNLFFVLNRSTRFVKHFGTVSAAMLYSQYTAALITAKRRFAKAKRHLAENNRRLISQKLRLNRNNVAYYYKNGNKYF